MKILLTTSQIIFFSKDCKAFLPDAYVRNVQVSILLKQGTEKTEY